MIFISKVYMSPNDSEISLALWLFVIVLVEKYYFCMYSCSKKDLFLFLNAFRHTMKQTTN